MNAIPFVIFGVLISLCLVLAVVFLSGKGSFLITGFNTMSKEVRSVYDEKALCRFYGVLMLVFSFCISLILIGVCFDVMLLVYCGSLTVILGVFNAAVYTNTSSRFRKNGSSNVSTVVVGKGSSKNNSKIVSIVGVAILVIVFIAVGVMVSYGVADPTVNVSASDIEIKAMYGLTIDFSDVANVTLVEKSMRDIGVGRRVDGFGGFGAALKGNFRSDSLGDVLLFVQADSSPTIWIERVNDKDVYLSFRSDEATSLLYAELLNSFELL